MKAIEALALVGGHSDKRGKVGRPRTAEEIERLVIFGAEGLRRTLAEYLEQYHEERHHQGKDNVLLFPTRGTHQNRGEVQCKERLGGLLKLYHREAA